MSNTLPPLEVLDVEGESTSMGSRWEKWKRSLLVYLEAAEVTSPPKKRATLLHFGGTGLQEIYYNLPGAQVEVTDGSDVFKTAVEKLEEFFLPKQNRIYERHMFRLIKQEDGEKFERFLVKLRKQADKCDFDKKDEHLIDQITEKCNSAKLRKKILTIGDDITLDKIITEANTLEIVNNQLENYGNKKEGSQEINANISPYWSNKQDEAFKELKTTLTRIQSLGYYDVHDKTQVIADASPVGLGAVLVQTDPKSKNPRIIAYGNRTLTQCERKYSQTEKEALALVWSVEHFNIFLFGKKFDLITDHKPLEVLFGPKSKPCARIERWVLRLQSYTFTVIYKPGKTNIADPLSRLCISESVCEPKGDEEYVHQVVEQARPKAIALEDITQASLNDREISNVKKAIYENIWEESVKCYKVFENELCYYGDILLRGNRIVIPHTLRKDVLDAAHEGHPGIVAMKGRLRSKVWWPRIDKDAENLVKSCKSCTLVGKPNPPVPMKRRELPLAPWIDVAMDLLGPLPNHEYLLVVVDYYSRYKEVKMTKSTTSSQIIMLLKEIFSRLGYPISITADNGRQFVSEEFRTFCKECNITLFNTTPYWPQQNGEVERQNRDILKRLKISHMEKRNLRESLWEYLIMYNSTPHGTTGKSPAELFFRRQNRDKIPSLDGRQYEDIDMDVRDRDKTQKEKGKEYGDRKRRAVDTTLAEGDKVYIKNMEKSNKLSPEFNDIPYTVESTKHGDVTVRNDQTGQTLRRNVVHLKKIEGQWTTVQDKHCDESRNDSTEDD